MSKQSNLGGSSEECFSIAKDPRELDVVGWYDGFDRPFAAVGQAEDIIGILTLPFVERDG